MVLKTRLAALLLLLTQPFFVLHAQSVPFGFEEFRRAELRTTGTTHESEPQSRVDPLLFWHGGKVIISGLTMGTAITDPDLSQTDRVIVGGVSLLLGVPAIGVLHNSVTGNPTAIRSWRIVGLVVDLGLSATLIGYGVRQAVDSDPTNDWSAVASISVGGLGLLLSALNAMPLRIERERSAHIHNQ
ncbi:MAG: hypothetical protein EA383_17965 [Spirochaetaceae bacterium]|nr:MAG: hypothetical protein EA383_17965 [Spirochaetaceae bacterium]